MDGWMGTIFRVDLTSGVCIALTFEPFVAKDCIGGWGLGIQLLNQEVDPSCDALYTENPLIMPTGPL